MTNELEKTFFDTFEIEPKSVKRTLKLAMQGYDESDLPEDLKQFISSQAQVYNVYPQITDSILLELICILGNTSYFLITDDGLPIDVDGLKKSVLHSLTLQAKVDKNKVLKHQVRTLFEEK